MAESQSTASPPSCQECKRISAGISCEVSPRQAPMRRISWSSHLHHGRSSRAKVYEVGETRFPGSCSFGCEKYRSSCFQWQLRFVQWQQKGRDYKAFPQGSGRRSNQETVRSSTPERHSSLCDRRRREFLVCNTFLYFFIPVLILVCFFFYIVASMIVTSQRNATCALSRHMHSVLTKVKNRLAQIRKF